MKAPRSIIGIDEAGRGPLAGPVSVGVVCVPPDFDWGVLPGVNDSKQLSESAREVLFVAAKQLQKDNQLQYIVAMVSAKVIDRIGIVPAIRLAMKRALVRIDHDPANVLVKLDGSLAAPDTYLDQETIIKGDSKVKAIALASIMAKVTRDRYMVRKASQTLYAPYDVAQHKGYGTKAHRVAIAKRGLSPEHRKSFCRSIKVL